MKKIIVLLAIAGFFTQAQAQKMLTKNVPAAVTAAFYKAYPTQKDVDWSREGNNYEATYKMGKMDMSAEYDASGMLVETEMEIVKSALPAAVMSYVKDKYKEDEVKEASKITNGNGIVTYEAEVKGMDLLFDSNGSFIKATKKHAEKD